MLIVKKLFGFMIVCVMGLSLNGCLILDATTDTTVQITDAVTHATSDILSSTSGDASTADVRVKKLKMFAKHNSMNLQQDIAQGRGEYLSSLESLLEVPAQHHDEFVQFAQSNYETFYSHEGDTANDILVAQLARFGSEEMSQALYVQMAEE